MSCRICRSQDAANLVDLFAGDADEMSTLRSYVEVTVGVEMNYDDLVSKSICNTCVDVVRYMYHFRVIAIKNDKDQKEEAGQNNQVYQLVPDEPPPEKDFFPENQEVIEEILSDTELEPMHPSVKKLYEQYTGIDIPSEYLLLDLNPKLELQKCNLSKIGCNGESQMTIEMFASQLDLAPTIEQKNDDMDKSLTSIQKTDSIYVCEACNKLFDTKKRLRVHSKKHFSCKICLRYFDKNFLLQKHLRFCEKAATNGVASYSVKSKSDLKLTLNKENSVPEKSEDNSDGSKKLKKKRKIGNERETSVIQEVPKCVEVDTVEVGKSGDVPPLMYYKTNDDNDAGTIETHAESDVSGRVKNLMKEVFATVTPPANVVTNGVRQISDVIFEIIDDDDDNTTVSIDINVNNHETVAKAATSQIQQEKTNMVNIQSVEIVKPAEYTQDIPDLIEIMDDEEPPLLPVETSTKSDEVANMPDNSQNLVKPHKKKKIPIKVSLKNLVKTKQTWTTGVAPDTKDVLLKLAEERDFIKQLYQRGTTHVSSKETHISYPELLPSVEYNSPHIMKFKDLQLNLDWHKIPVKLISEPKMAILQGDVVETQPHTLPPPNYNFNDKTPIGIKTLREVNLTKTLNLNASLKNAGKTTNDAKWSRSKSCEPLAIHRIQQTANPVYQTNSFHHQNKRTNGLLCSPASQQHLVSNVGHYKVAQTGGGAQPQPPAKKLRVRNPSEINSSS